MNMNNALYLYKRREVVFCVGNFCGLGKAAVFYYI